MYDDEDDKTESEKIWLFIGICSIIPIIFFILMLFVMLMKSGNML